MKDYDKAELEKKVYDFLSKNKPDLELIKRVWEFENPYLIWQAYVETVDSLGMLWTCFGRESRGITDRDYSLAHIMMFKQLSSGEQRIIVCKMENLMATRPFMRSEETLELYKELCN